MVQQLVGMLRNLSADVPRLLHIDEAGVAQVRDLSEDVFAEPLERARAVRDFFAWPGKRNYEGLWWSSSNRGLVRFESLLEQQAIEWFDFDPSVAAMSSQPFALLWPRGAQGQTWHVPDLFLRRLDGSARVVDVRPESRIDADAVAQFDRTREACAAVGWAYEVFPGLCEPLALNVRFLGGYRFDRCRPTDVDQNRVLQRLQRGSSLRDSLDDLAGTTSASRKTVLVHLYNLLWRQMLHTDLNVPLRMESVVTA